MHTHILLADYNNSLLLAAAIPAAKLARLDTLIPTASHLQTCRWLGYYGTSDLDDKLLFSK